MKDYIVKVKAGDIHGTGVVIDKNLILVANHVIEASKDHSLVEYNDTFIPCHPIANENGVVLLQAESDLDCLEFASLNVIEFFDNDTEWKIMGFIGEEPVEHLIYGKGVVELEFDTNGYPYSCTHSLYNILSGKRSDYSGMSGSPVIINDMIVGIVQRQNGEDEIIFVSVKSFEGLVKDYIKCNKLINELKYTYNQSTVFALEKNKKSGKYIPDIFVEDGRSKEYARCFAEPDLFLKKYEKQLINISVEDNFNKGKDIIGSHEYFQKYLNNTDITLVPNIIADIESILSRIKRDKPDINGCNMEEYYSNDRWNCAKELVLENIKKHLEYTKSTILIYKDKAGQGKTNFLCDFAQNFLLKKNYTVLYFNASEFGDDIIDYVKDKLRCRYSWDYIINLLNMQCFNNQEYIYILIDGLNENDNSNFTSTLVKFLNEFSQYDFIKIIMTTRTESYDKRFGELERQPFSPTVAIISPVGKHYYFKERILKGYLNFFDIEISPVCYSEAAINTLLDDVLLLRFFCEVYRGKKQVHLYNLYKHDLFKEYINQKKKQYNDDIQHVKFDDIINAIIEAMLKKDNYVSVEISTENFSYDLIKDISILADNDVIIKKEEYLKKGLLKETVNTISFTFDEFRDYCLTIYILTKRPELFLSKCERWQVDNKSILEGVKRYAFCLGKAIKSNEIIELLKKLNNYDGLFIENIFLVDDGLIEQEDLELVNSNLLPSGKYVTKTICSLCSRFDVTWFPILNITILFDLFRKLLAKPGIFNRYINSYISCDKTLNANIYADYSIRNRKMNIFEIVYSLSCNIEDESYIRNRENLLYLTVFLYELDRDSINCLWSKMFITYTDYAIEIFKRIILENRIYIHCNVYEIMTSIKYEELMKDIFTDSELFWELEQNAKLKEILMV